MINRLILLLSLIFSSIGFTQVVNKVVKNYVLFISNYKIGDMRDTLEVRRNINNEYIKVGEIVIVKIDKRKYGCQIIEGKIKIGDFIHSRGFTKNENILNTISLNKNEIRNNINRFCLNIGTAIPVDQLGKTHNIGYQIEGIYRIPTANSKFIIDIGTNYSFFTGKTYYLYYYQWGDIIKSTPHTYNTFKPFCFFVGPQYCYNAGYILLSVTASFNKKWNGLGIDYCLGYYIPIGNGHKVFDTKVKLSIMNLFNKKKEEDSLFYFMISIGVFL